MTHGLLALEVESWEQAYWVTQRIRTRQLVSSTLVRVGTPYVVEKV
jgi:hypothetical protein